MEIVKIAKEKRNFHVQQKMFRRDYSLTLKER